jgi:hypothetical protein
MLSSMCRVSKAEVVAQEAVVEEEGALADTMTEREEAAAEGEEEAEEETASESKAVVEMPKITITSRQNMPSLTPIRSRSSRPFV